MSNTKGFAWHVHHNILVEWCYNFEERTKVIKESKPKNEIETRLRLFKMVKSKLPKEVVEAWQKWDDIMKKHTSYFEELHKKECSCKEWDGRKIVFDKEG